MNKVRFSCPRCQTVMQTNDDKIGFDIACPHCAYRFKLVEPTPAAPKEDPSGASAAGNANAMANEQTIPPRSVPAGSNNPYVAPVQARPPSTQDYPVKPANRFQCPYCQTNTIPQMKSEISTVGWIVFGVLLVTTCVFCWIGFFIKDNFRVCSQCGIRL